MLFSMLVGLFVYGALIEIHNALKQVSVIHEPIVSAAYEMEINVVEIAFKVLEVQSRDRSKVKSKYCQRRI